ncbi:MAG: M48 family metallopeptidase [Bacteroides sp.]|nr:M48 family metallopeptidase [Bacteroides sp.]MBD5321101.1 M48 family metallopeptidase [Bacteroides sp.]
MKKLFIALFALCLGCGFSASAQNWSKIGSGALKAAKALTLSDADMAAYCKQSVEWMDAHNPVLPDNNPYTQRLKRLTEGITDADGIPLNFKVYDVVDVNAFACPDGSVRVFSSLMDIMTDDELLGIIGHEIGHVVKRHSKNAFKHELMTGAVKDALAASNGTLAKLSDSQLGDLSASLIGAKYSQKQEKEADNCGYDFLVAHGKNPWGMVMAFEKFLNMESGAQSSYINKMFSSHPDTKSRIEAMTKRCNKDGFTRPAEK